MLHFKKYPNLLYGGGFEYNKSEYLGLYGETHKAETGYRYSIGILYWAVGHWQDAGSGYEQYNVVIIKKKGNWYLAGMKFGLSLYDLKLQRDMYYYEENDVEYKDHYGLNLYQTVLVGCYRSDHFYLNLFRLDGELGSEVSLFVGSELGISF